MNDGILENDEDFLKIFEEHLHILDDESLETLWQNWDGCCPFMIVLGELFELYHDATTIEEKDRYAKKIFRIVHLIIGSGSYAPAALYFQNECGNMELEYAMSGIMDKVRMAKTKESLK